MKTLKRLISLSIVIVIAVSAWAVPAYRGWQERTLTDGTPITVRLVGDEAYHHWETQDGKIATMLSNGKFVVSNEQAPSKEQVVKLRKAAAARRNINMARKNYGAIQPTKLLVILVNFSDKSMKTAHNNAFFDNLLNGSFPSVQDYFKQSSGNTYVPVFDVYGPYTLDRNMAYYGANDSNGDDEHPDQMVVDACAKAYADGCNFSNYDTNEDGKVDNIYVIYAGYGEAAGAPANTIWPHSWEIYSSNVTGTLTYNGKTLGHYACSAELSGKSGSNSDGVGTFAHEFSHVIGLPDYYDTDYGTNSDNGVTPGEWTLMDQGSYNGSGQYPPLYSAYDKYFMGWMTPKFLAKDEVKNVTLTTTWNDNYQITGGASRVACTNTSTVYYIENRQKSGYDQYLPGHGMVVWKVQYNATRWNNNDLNNTAGTLRYTIIPADGKTKNYGDGADPFPGTKNKKTWTPFTGCALTEITESGSNITFSYNGGVPKLTWDYVLYGENCTYPDDGEITKGGALNLTITPNSGYSLADAACWDVQMGGTSLTYGTDFTYNSGTNTFSIASVTGDVEIIMSAGHPVTWHDKGVTYAINIAAEGKITLPAAPANCSASRQFVGWCTNSTYKSADTPPTYAKTGDAYSVADYYAVYADVSGSGGSADATYTFTSKSWEATEGDWTSGQDGTAYLNSGVQVTQTTTGANATCPTSYSNISSIVVSYCTNASKGAGSIKMTVDGNDVSESVTSTGGTTPRDLEFDFSGTTPTGAPTITVNCNTNSIYICGLTITYGSASYSGFSTDCTAPDPCALTSISLNTTGVTKAFTVGDAFNSDGLVVTANYSNCSSKTVTPNSVSTPDMSSTGNKTVTVSYTESAVTKTATYDITVSAATTYAIRFFDDATMLKEESLIMGATATPPSVDDCEEYEFIGWYTTTLATTNTTSHTWVSDFTVTGAQDYYAVFRHTEGGGGGGTSEVASVTFVTVGSDSNTDNSGTDAKIKDNIVDAYTGISTFSGSKLYAGTAGVKLGSGSAIGSITLNLTSAANVKTVKVNATKYGSDTGTLSVTAGSTSVGSAQEPPASTGELTFTAASAVENASTITVATSSKRAYISSIVVIAEGGGSGTTYYTTTKDCTIPTEVTVKFDANGGEGTMTDQTIDYNTATALKANTFERTGYTFLGWATSSSGAQVYDDEEVVTLTKKVTTLYALWEKNSWKVYFTTPSGATSVTANGETTSPLTIEYGEAVTIVITPDAEHNISTVTATGGAVLSGEGGTRTFTMPDADVAISIVMVPKPTYTINFINMGENISSQSVMEGQAAIKPADPSACEGYTFVGWWTDNLAIDNTTAETWITDFTVTGNQDYYAVYSHTASGGGSSPGSKTFNFAALAAAGSWTDGSYHTSIEDAPVTLTANGGGNNGRYYVSDDSWRLYNGGSISISVTNGDVTSVSSSPSKTFTITDGDASLSLSATTKFTSITVNYTVSGGSTTTYTTAPDCTPCLTRVTLTKGAESHGTFTLDKADGAHNNCTSNFVVTVSNITPADGYRFVNVTATGGNSEVTGPDGSGNYTVTYTKENSITSTITANFEEIPSHTVTWHSNGDESNTATYKEGQAIVFPETATGCDGKTFMGWSAVAVPEQDDAPVYTTSALMGTSDVTYYAVFATASGSGGGAWDGTTPGTYKIYAIVDEVKYYATASMSSGKLASTTNVAEAADFTFAVYNSGWSIKTGTTYITYSSSTNLSTSASAYEWSISSGTHGTWHLDSETSGRSWIFRSGADVFGGYASGNVDGSIYYDLEIGSGSSTTYSGYTTSCTPCLTKVTLTKGEESNGTFTLSKANGEYNNCTSNFVVTVSDITPASGYYCIGVTATGDHNTVTGPDGSGNYTVTYEKENAITSTITANFALIPTYTVTWSMDGDESNTANYHEGDAIVFPGTATGCDGKVFRGWSAITIAETDVEPTYVTSATMPAHDVTYYAVFAEASTGSGTPSTLLSENFSSITNGNSTSTSGSSTSWSGNTNIEYVSAAYQAGGAVRIGGGSSTGSIETKAVSATAGSTLTVSFDVKGWTSVEGNIRVTVTDCTPQVIAYTAVMSGGFENKSAEFTLVSDNPTVTIATTAKRAFIDNVVITSGGGTTYSGYSTTCGASISAQNIGWITTSAGQKVKRVINVSAKNFDDPTTLSATCANSNFSVTLGASAVPAGTTGLTTTLTVEYTPTASDTRDENVEIVLTAGDKSRTITVSGRSVPDEFLLITKKSSTWYALPANMNSGANEYNGVEVNPNDATTPTSVAVSPTTLIYNLASVASSRYTANGHLVRLVGNSNKCLWGNKATGATKVNIQNYAVLSESNGDNYEWDLKTTDGVRYYVESPCNAEYAEGRRLAYGTKFGMYKEETVFFIVRAGCTSQPGEVNVSPRRVDATFSWVSNTTEMHIDLYTNELMTEGHLTATVSSSPYVFSGLAETTDYWYKLTPGDDTDCAVTGTFKTTGPIIDIVEWQENGVVLFIDKGEINPVIVIDGQEEHGSISGGGGNATELFFAKYFEGAGSMKLVSIFNGTKNDISLSPYSIYVKMRGGSGSWSPGNDVNLDLGTLSSIKAGQEIIFFSRPLGTETELDGCSSSFLDDKVTNCSSAESNPRWVECDGGTFSKINFNGNDPILLKKSGTLIDVIGSENGGAPTATNCLSGDSEKGWAGTVRNMDKGKSPSDPAFDAFYEASSISPVTTQDSTDLLSAFGINLDDDEIALTTARCIFFRDKRVTSGDSAVLLNDNSFITFTNHDEFKSEWYGRSVCMNNAAKTAAGVSNDAQATCNSYQDIANMDYNQYYIDWTNIEEGKELSTFTSDPETKEYTIPITNMSQYACLNLRFQLKLAGEVLTEAAQQVPIVVTGNVDTNDPLFSELVEDKDTHEKLYPQSVTRCSTCDVVVLGTGKLTKGPDGDSKDVPEIGNLKIYPGGKLIVPSGTNYTVNSLSFRRQEDDVSTADVQGTLNVKEAGNHVYLDFRVDPTNWHYFSLPYDCNVADIRYANPDETDIPVLGTNFLLKYYDGDKRAATQAGGCWEMVSPDATLRKGLGYIFAIPGDGKVKTEFRFPMANGVIADDQNDKLVQGIYGYGCDKDYTQVRANHRGWNLVGNPYFLPYQSKIENPVMTGYIVEDHSVDPWDGHYKFNDPVNDLRYIVEPVDNGWSEYRQVAITNYSMTPFTSYFVQIGGTDPAVEQGIQFVQTQVTGRSSIVRRSPAEYEETEDTHPVWCAVTLTNVNGEKDETTMLISNDFTDNYDIMNDLVKMRGSYYQYKQITTKPVLASRNNEGEMAFNALPDSSALAGIPLNYFAAFQGEYVFAYDNKYDRDGEVKEVKLLDIKTNTWYDLMSESYAFTTNREDNTTRFILSIRVERKTPHVATDLDLTNTPDDRPRKILINDHVYIQRGGAIYDITGKQVLNY